MCDPKKLGAGDRERLLQLSRLFVVLKERIHVDLTSNQMSEVARSLGLDYEHLLPYLRDCSTGSHPILS